MSRLFFGPIKNPTWRDFVVRVGGAAVVIVVVILAAQALIPGREGVAVIAASAVLVAFAAIQEVRHNRYKKKSKQCGSRK